MYDSLQTLYTVFSHLIVGTCHPEDVCSLQTLYIVFSGSAKKRHLEKAKATDSWVLSD